MYLLQCVVKTRTHKKFCIKYDHNDHGHTKISWRFWTRVCTSLFNENFCTMCEHLPLILDTKKKLSFAPDEDPGLWNKVYIITTDNETRNLIGQ
jgi:hypothetical protein